MTIEKLKNTDLYKFYLDRLIAGLQAGDYWSSIVLTLPKHNDRLRVTNLLTTTEPQQWLRTIFPHYPDRHSGILLVKVWVSKDLSVKPSADPKRRSSVIAYEFVNNSDKGVEFKNATLYDSTLPMDENVERVEWTGLSSPCSNGRPDLFLSGRKVHSETGDDASLVL